ncbi:Uncharacterised protein [Candidatus Gugararchaeum adminiculabundum]|nr:Uncharacterised protein [Candidatus Gugararchaeum adminiculabundum]
MLIYVYDLKIRGLKEYNTLKRRFYYNLKHSSIAASPWKTKSVLFVKDDLETAADTFFKRYTGFVEVYKARVSDLESVV